MTILLLTTGVYVQTCLIEENDVRNARREEFERDYTAVMLGKTALPPTIEEAVNELERTLQRIKQERGIEGVPRESVGSKLALALRALSSCAGQTGLDIDTITITDKGIHITGSTSSRRHTMAVFEAMEKNGLKVRDNRGAQEGDRDNFDATFKPMKLSERS